MLCENLKKAREKKGFSQKEVADLIGISQVALHYFETGLKVPSVPTLISLSSVLEESMDALVK